MKKILIPIDFTFKSYDAIDYAVSFFKREKCHFYFLNTYSYDIEGLNAVNLLQAGDDFFEKPKRESEMSLGRVIQKITSKCENKRHQFNAISEYANLIEGVRKAIKELDIDLVVIAGKVQTKRATDTYSKNTKRILDNIRECPVMIIPASTPKQKKPEFVLVSNFEVLLSESKLKNWYEFVEISRGSVKIFTLCEKDKMTKLQKENQNKVRFQIEMLSKNPVGVEYIETAPDLKSFADYHSDYIICVLDRKPDFWQKCGLTHSRITNMGPLQKTPLIALHP
ncbi:universal stress protein [Cochleicola gelatinilyticus]|uniref:UspA domain-containing protein n=1 Tax=Cochleicola gelatinilyticus TaxID=1763537 RepID=A0A167HII5_9FLAO|nr:universal stress protein [Cochleicola gelatinilyticus]OAB78648.1 hypothetical protein ULVI_08680 [Cochleicola gelatinilyticus]